MKKILFVPLFEHIYSPIRQTQTEKCRCILFITNKRQIKLHIDRLTHTVVCQFALSVVLYILSHLIDRIA